MTYDHVVEATMRNIDNLYCFGSLLDSYDQDSTEGFPWLGLEFCWLINLWFLRISLSLPRSKISFKLFTYTHIYVHTLIYMLYLFLSKHAILFFHDFLKHPWWFYPSSVLFLNPQERFLPCFSHFPFHSICMILSSFHGLFLSLWSPFYYPGFYGYYRYYTYI